MYVRAAAYAPRKKAFEALKISNFAVDNLSAAKNMLCIQEARLQSANISTKRIFL